ncbi:MAG: serine/threonine-protein kinase [Rudaea sp.]|nr:serine/threonine-protein kinase [Rudaea sp.]
MNPDSTSKDQLERLAARIADDEPVDWRDAGNVNPALQGLREMEQLVQGFRHVQVSDGRDTPRSGRFRFGALTVLEPLGSGTQGDVWRAYDPMLDLHVALKLRKVGSGALAHEFLDEARRLARVRQANIVSVYGAAVNEGRAGLWTELIRGTSLAQLLAQHGPFPAEEVRGIGLDLCHALATVHRHDLLHGDIKAENVMREVSGRIVLMDFGAARELDSRDAAVVSGTLNYLAPEVLRGAAPSPASDIYALGVLLFRLISGVYPYAAEDLDGLLRLQEGGKRARLDALKPDTPGGLVRAVECALERDPARRHASALAFAGALAPAPPRATAAWRPAFLVLAALAVVLAAGLSLGLGRWHSVPLAAWQAQAAFYRIGVHGAVALADGETIALGDRLALKFRSDRAAYLYIFDDDGSSEAAVLFPLQGLDPANPLAANTDYQLPGKTGTSALTWQVSSHAEREEFVVLASDTPQPQLERAVAVWQHAGAANAGAARGVLGLTAVPDDTQIRSASLRAVLATLDADAEGGGLRRWRFVFPHAAQ